MRPLQDIREVVDRAIFLRLQSVTVDNGWTADAGVFENDPAGFVAALAAIVTARGFAIEIYGAGSNHDKDDLAVPRIVYNPQRFIRGDIGGAHTVYNETAPQVFDKAVSPPNTSNFQFAIHLASESAEQDRILHAIIGSALTNRSYIPFEDNSNRFLIEHYGYYDDPEIKKGLIRSVYLYNAFDVFESGDDVLRSDIVGINEIDVIEPDTTQILNVQ